MAVESKRGCGYRKVGGLYLVSDGAGAPCCKLPILLHICPTCNQGIKQSRGWSWIDPRPWLAGPCKIDRPVCPGASPEYFLGEKVGLLWIGEKFYPTADAFMAEAHRMGISRRIAAVPRGFEIGKHWVFFAHPALVKTENGEKIPGVFHICKPTRLEKIVTETMARDADLMADLDKRNITPVVVPDDDRDHQGSVHDDDVLELPLDNPKTLHETLANILGE